MFVQIQILRTDETQRVCSVSVSSSTTSSSVWSVLQEFRFSCLHFFTLISLSWAMWPLRNSCQYVVTPMSKSPVSSVVVFFLALSPCLLSFVSSLLISLLPLSSSLWLLSLSSPPLLLVYCLLAFSVQVSSLHFSCLLFSCLLVIWVIASSLPVSFLLDSSLLVSFLLFVLSFCPLCPSLLFIISFLFSSCLLSSSFSASHPSLLLLSPCADSQFVSLSPYKLKLVWTFEDYQRPKHQRQITKHP